MEKEITKVTQYLIKANEKLRSTIKMVEITVIG